MTDHPRHAALVLDTSAVAAWVRGSVSVGELLTEIDAEGGAVIVPLTCLIEAAAAIADGREWLDLLVRHPTTQLLADDPEDWRMLTATRALLGRADLASAAWFAVEYGVDVLTQHGDRYADMDGGSMVLLVED